MYALPLRAGRGVLTVRRVFRSFAVVALISTASFAGPWDAGARVVHTATYDPASLAAGAARCDNVTVAGVRLSAGPVTANAGGDPATGCVVAAVRVTADDTVRVCWRNALDALTACDTASSAWTFAQ